MPCTAGPSGAHGTGQVSIPKTSGMQSDRPQQHLPTSLRQQSRHALRRPLPHRIGRWRDQRIAGGPWSRAIRRGDGPGQEAAVDVLQLLCLLPLPRWPHRRDARRVDRRQQGMAMGLRNLDACDRSIDSGFPWRIHILSEQDTQR